MLNHIKKHKALLYQEYERYVRQIAVEEINTEGQNRLKNVRIAFIGAGGLNSSGLLYLSACGVGKIGIIDNDVIETSNLQRQVIYQYQDVRKKKSLTAHEALASLNPLISIESCNKKLTEQNILDLLSKYEVVIDGTDNFKTRYLISQYCYRLHKIHIYGAIDKFTGQISIFNYQNSGNYYSLHSKISYQRTHECNAIGIINTLAGAIGLLQATEAIKIITGTGKISAQTLIVFNLLSCTLNKTQIKFSKLLNSTIITKAKNYSRKKYIPAMNLHAANQAYKLIDIRTALEFKFSSSENAINIPLSKLKKQESIRRIKELRRNYRIAIYCNNTTRSHIASQILQKYSIDHYIFDNRKKAIRKERDSNPR